MDQPSREAMAGKLLIYADTEQTVHKKITGPGADPPRLTANHHSSCVPHHLRYLRFVLYKYVAATQLPPPLSPASVITFAPWRLCVRFFFSGSSEKIGVMELGA